MQPYSSNSIAARKPIRLPGLSASQAEALWQAARRADTAPPPQRGGATAPLAGRHVALVSAAPDGASAQVFAHAAQALGARVVQIQPADLGLADAASAQDTARLLGRLYAAVGCSGLDNASLALLKRGCAAPVLHDLAAATHASRLLADVMTLHEAQQAWHAGWPRLGVLGRPRSRLLAAWRHLAEAAQVQVVDLSAHGDHPLPEGCDFICVPQDPPLLLAQGQSLLAQQTRQHQKVVQTLLNQALGF